MGQEGLTILLQKKQQQQQQQKKQAKAKQKQKKTITFSCDNYFCCSWKIQKVILWSNS